jgi:hypothetical protein
MTNNWGHPITERRNPGGSISFAVDFGEEGGKRSRKSFKTLPEAMVATPLFGNDRDMRRAALGEIEAEKERLMFLQEVYVDKLGEIEERMRQIEHLQAGAGVRPVELDGCPVVVEVPLTGCGIYFLCDEDSRILYVGQSVDVGQRLGRHRQRGLIPFKRVFFIPCERERLVDLEYYWIQKLSPPLNGDIPIPLNPYFRAYEAA